MSKNYQTPVMSPGSLRETLKALQSSITSPVERVIIDASSVMVYYASGSVFIQSVHAEPVHAEPEQFPLPCLICGKPHSQSERRGPAHA